MSICIDGSVLVMKLSRLEKCYPGGVRQFLSDLPNGVQVSDGRLLGLSYMVFEDLRAVEKLLNHHGMVGIENGIYQDYAVLTQEFGLLSPCDWLEFEILPSKESVCWIAGEAPGKISYSKNSSGKSEKLDYFTPEEAASRLVFQKCEEGVAEFKDLQTGKHQYVGFSDPSALSNLLYNRLRYLSNRILENDDKRISDHEENEKAGLPIAEIIDEVDHLLQTAGPHQAFAALVQGKAYRSTENWHKAEESFRRHFEYEGAIPTVLLDLTWALGVQGKLDQALVCAQKAVSIMKDSAAAWGNLANVQMQLGQTSSARKSLDQALVLDPADQKNLYLNEKLNHIPIKAVECGL